MFLLPWCLLGAILGISGFLNAAVRARAWASERVWHSPIPFHASVLVFALWALSMTLLLPGLVTGVVAITQRGPHRAARAVAFAVLVAGGCVADYFVPKLNSQTATPGSFVHGGRLATLSFTAVAVLVAVGGARLLGLRFHRVHRRGEATTT